jgi:hypothetical protein
MNAPMLLMVPAIGKLRRSSVSAQPVSAVGGHWSGSRVTPRAPLNLPALRVHDPDGSDPPRLRHTLLHELDVRNLFTSVEQYASFD